MIEVRWQDHAAEPLPRAPSTMRNIAEGVAAKHGLTLAQIRGPERRRYISHPRQEAYAIIYATGRFSLPQIGRWFGGRDHTTVLKGLREYAKRQGRGQ